MKFYIQLQASKLKVSPQQKAEAATTSEITQR